MHVLYWSTLKNKKEHTVPNWVSGNYLSDNTYYLMYLNLALTLHSRSCYFLYLTDKKTEEQWGKSQCPVSHKYWEAGIWT